MRIIAAFIFFFLMSISLTAQVYSRGGASQLYWDWRPDIANNCYEFTFENYLPAKLLPPHYDYKIAITYWDDCNYGKMYVVDSNCTLVHLPLIDTLYRVTSYYGERDTLCGFDIPYNIGTSLNFSETNSPVKTKVVYKGLVHLPEKCNAWHFTLSKAINSNGLSQYYCTNGCRGDSYPAYMNTKSNIDSFALHMAYNSEEILGSIIKLPIGCSYDNTEHSNNSSSRFMSSPPKYFQANKEIKFNFGNFDPDHDSIVFSIPDTIKSAESLTLDATGDFFCSWDTVGNYIPEVLTLNYFFAPLIGSSGANPPRFNSLNNPFDTDSTFNLNDSTGKIVFTAKSAMEPLLYVKATEYRKGKFLSEKFIISQFTIMNENREPSYFVIDTSSIANALFNNQGTLMSCIGLPISFDAWVKLSVANANLVVRSTADTTLPGNGVCTITNNHSDSVHLKFNWTVPNNARGLFNLFISAKDSNCTIAPYNHYTQVYTVSFYIDSCLSPLSVLESPQLEKGLTIYPNPNSGLLNISCKEVIKHVEIYNALSQVMFKKEFANSSQREIDISNLPDGMYFIRVNGFLTKSILIRR